MNYNSVYQKVELAFWDTVIYMLDEVKPIQFVVRTAYRYLQGSSLRQLTATILKVALAGFLSGISLFLLLSALM